MTNIKFFKNKKNIVGFEVKGHTGKAELGKDVLCSAISSVTQNTLMGIVEVLKLDADFQIKDGFLSVMLKETEYENEYAQVLFKTCLLSLKEITKNEKKYVKLEEENEI